MQLQNEPKDPNALDPSTVGNWFYIYGGPRNPKSYNKTDNYDLPPKNVSDKVAFSHDKNYDEKGAVGGLDLVLNFNVINDDVSFVKNQFAITGMYLSQFQPTAIGGAAYVPQFDPVTGQPPI